MAKNADKSLENAEALDAVQEALSIEYTDDELSPEELRKLEESLLDVTSELTGETEPTKGKLPSERLDESASRGSSDDLDFLDNPPAPANDEHEAELASLVYNIQQKPKSSVLLWTGVFSILWLAACAVYGYVFILPQLETPVQLAGLASNGAASLLAVIAVLGLLPLWAFGFLMKRAHEMRHASRSMLDAALRLLQPDKIATGSIATVGTAIRREVAAIGNGMEQAVARAGELEFMVQKEVMSLERSYGDSEMRLRRLVEDISREREEVVGHAEQLRQAIQGSQSDFTSNLETAGSRIEEQIKSLTETLNASLSEGGHSITTQLTERSKELVELLETAGKQVEEKLGTGKDQLSSEFTKRAKEISEVIGLSGRAVANLMDARFAQINAADKEVSGKLEEGRITFEQTIEARKQELADVLSAANQSVSSLLKSNSAEIVEQSNATIERLEAGRTALRQELEKQVSDIETSASRAAASLSEAAENSAGVFESRSEKIVSQLEDNLSVRAGDFESRITEVGERIDGAIAERISTIDTTLSTSGSNLVSALGMRTEALGKVLQERTAAIGETMASKLSGFGENMTGHVDNAVNMLSNQTEVLRKASDDASANILQSAKSVEDVIRNGEITLNSVSQQSVKASEETTAKVTAAMKQAEVDLAASMAKGASEFSRGILQRQEQLEKVFEGNLQLFSRTATEKGNEFSELIGLNTNTLIDGLTEKTTNLASKLNQGAHRISTELEDKSRSAIEKMETNIRDLETRLQTGTNEIGNQFAAGNEILGSRLEEGKEKLLTSIAQSVNAAGNTMDDKAAKISDLLENRARMINESLGSELVQTQRQLEGKTEELNSMLRERTAELRTMIDEDAKPIVSAIEASGEAVREKLTGLAETVFDQTNDLFGKLGGTTAQLEQLIAQSTSNMETIRGELANQTHAFSSAVQHSFDGIERSHSLASDVEQRLYKISASLGENISSVSERLEQQGNALQDATRLLDHAQNNLHDTLESKQAALENLARGLAAQTQDVNASMNGFSQTVSSLVSEVSARSGQVGCDVAKEIASAIDDATSRFGDTVEAMRSAAATMRSELEETREQMRRGVLELPDETAQSASAMRRVVTDQIAALRDLSSIVERSGKMFDATPAPERVAPPAPQRAAPAPAPRAPAAPFPPNTSAQRQSPPPIPRAPQPVAPQPPRAPNTSESGWVSDLLNRASRDAGAGRTPQPDARAPHHVVDSLNSLSMDIANAIDHETSVELWDRYQRGETNVFTRRLYTLQGQQTFDEIRRKYSRETEFRSAVDRYIDDFERLLSDSARQDPSGSTAQNYLNSDTGKVYTMLAHASGRLGN